MCATSKKPEFNVSADSIVAIGADGTHYLWAFGCETWQDKQAAREAYERIHTDVKQVVSRAWRLGSL